MNELDRILLESDAPPPSPGFKQSVMRAIRDEPLPDEPLGFPWRLVAVGLVLALVGIPLLVLWLQGAAASGGGAAFGKLPWLLGVLAASALSLYLPLELLRE